VVLFDFDSTVETPFSLTEDEKLYFEKFRMKNTVFEMTDKVNKLSTIKAKIVEEVEAGKKIYDLTAPEAKTFDNEKLLTLVAKRGRFNQSAQVLELSKNVVANYDKQMEITSNSATYNFDTERGFGNEKVVGHGEKGDFEADRFTFDKKKGEIVLLRNVYMKSGDTALRSPDKAMLFSAENKFISTNATLIQNKYTLKGDTLTIYFKDTKRFEIDKIYSTGHTNIISDAKNVWADKGEYDKKTGIIKLFNNVKITDAKGGIIYTQRGEYNENKGVIKLFEDVKITDPKGYTILARKGEYNENAGIMKLFGDVKITDKSGYDATAQKGEYNTAKGTFTLEENVQIKKGTSLIKAPKAIYFQNAGEFRFYGRVFVSQEEGTATADTGVYFIKKNIAELEHNVILEKNGNIVRGDKAIADLNTSKSRLLAKPGGRVSGRLFESTFKKKKD
jgi:LPS export ABC transporter protein LptC/lipopolysaccharide transport protein LptA